jgi:DNA-directed RNA polymerase subunit M/transcription elongation factor TFIIS
LQKEADATKIEELLNLAEQQLNKPQQNQQAHELNENLKEQIDLIKKWIDEKSLDEQQLKSNISTSKLFKCSHCGHQADRMQFRPKAQIAGTRRTTYYKCPVCNKTTRIEQFNLS